ncbi:MAG: hypothetical protein ACLU9S_03580 [Oscillospiraceae bacterium]
MGTSPNLCYIPGPDPPTNSAGGNREEQQDRTSNIIQFELGWNPHGSKGFSRLALRIGNLISNHYTNLDDDGKSGTIAVTTGTPKHTSQSGRQMAALIIAIFPQNSSRGNWEEQQDRTDPNSRFELARKPAWLLAFRQFGLPK